MSELSTVEPSMFRWKFSRFVSWFKRGYRGGWKKSLTTALKRLPLCWRILWEESGNLMAFADRELPRPDDEMQALMNSQIKEILLVFSTHGHSGFSASYARNVLHKLLDWQPLRPLTGEPGEWTEIGDGRFQNNRCGSVFKDSDRFDGQAYDSEAVIFEEPNGCCFGSFHSAQPVTFPYTPKRRYAKVATDATDADKAEAARMAMAQAETPAFKPKAK
jgi:hypothetical protein